MMRVDLILSVLSVACDSMLIAIVPVCVAVLDVKLRIYVPTLPTVPGEGRYRGRYRKCVLKIRDR